ncbi:MAG: hypothetical protein AAF802_32480 [Planctomycetota bacterium]
MNTPVPMNSSETNITPIQETRIISPSVLQSGNDSESITAAAINDSKAVHGGWITPFMQSCTTMKSIAQNDGIAAQEKTTAIVWTDVEILGWTPFASDGPPSALSE